MIVSHLRRAVPVAAVLLVVALAACTGTDTSAPPAPATSGAGSPGPVDPSAGTASDTTPVPARLEPPRNPYLADSPWPMAHQGPAQQASSSLPGPDEDVEVQLVDLRADAGIVRAVAQTSPFLVLSGRRYSDEPDGRAVWGASLTDLYKYALVDGQARYAHSQRLRSDPFSIHWNLLALADGRIVVPSPRGSDTVEESCRTDGPALLVFEDGDQIDSPFRCVQRLPALPEDAARCRGRDGAPVGPVSVGYSVTAANVTFTGELVTYFRLPTGPNGAQEHFVAAAKPDLSGWADCVFVSSTPVTNNFAIEPLADGGSALYVAASGSIVKVVWDPETGRLSRGWEREIPVRSRTGTTPTLVGYGDDALVAIVDAPCAVTNPFTGVIACDQDERPAQVIAVHRGDEDDRVHTVRLPESIRTVENSPSARGYQLVVAAYGGYDPDPSVKGVASVAWSPDREELELVWFNGDVQMNGVTSISEGSGLVYSSGVEQDGSVHLSGIRMWDAADGRAGQRVVDVEVAPADRVDAAFDQGNSTVIADDRTLVWATSEGFVVVHATQP